MLIARIGAWSDSIIPYSSGDQKEEVCDDLELDLDLDLDLHSVEAAIEKSGRPRFGATKTRGEEPKNQYHIHHPTASLPTPPYTPTPSNANQKRTSNNI